MKKKANPSQLQPDVMLSFLFTAPLPQGEYRTFSKEKSFWEAACNGHSFVKSGQTIAKCDGKWVKFFNDGKQVFDCNPHYAAANFIFCKA